MSSNTVLKHNQINRRNKISGLDKPFTPPEKIATVWGKGGEFVQICFQSRGCRYSNAGYCIMCDYGRGRNLTPEEVDSYLKTSGVLSESMIKELLIGTYGSCLDEYEISSECFKVILQNLSHCRVPLIGFETHCDTITERKLNTIKRFLSEREIYIEMGFESLDDTVRTRYLNKKMRIEDLKSAIEKIHSFGFKVILNVIIGAPFLTPHQQVIDVCRSVQWAFANGADSVILFPMNVKPFTLLYDLMHDGKYTPISHWRVVYTLNVLSELLTSEQLACTGLSWYGERGDIYQSSVKKMVAPLACGKCKDKLFDFYKKFQLEESGEQRKSLIRQMLNESCICGCRTKEEKELGAYFVKGA